MNEQIFITLVKKEGGLFDIGATLPLMAIQFLILMYLLNLILYNPLDKLINQRNDYILDNLTKTSEILLIAEELTKKYESELTKVKKEAQKEIATLEKIQKITFMNEVNFCQKSIDNLVQNFVNNFLKKKEIILKNITFEVDYLSQAIIQTLFQKQA